ncbi:aKG-HExxH-type peptide beta-hydroxylase [Rosenbergiella collisarenosi]|uniref:aKG-HExxH-type peptide beta-hydroxylase n=1 Tax=Rosenbergiella collisarenosi TaxID=1544695 RepID=UPI001F4E75AF|nr:HEXXH motif-containing putative peptide modification protein [Rosenbergiella collisarenosi]
MPIQSSRYNHTEFHEYFQNNIKESINYLIECSEADLVLPEKFSLRWNICGAHYLAIGAAENNNRELCVNYLTHAIKEAGNSASSSGKEIEISALDYNTQPGFDMNMLLRIINEDDKGVKVGFQSEKDTAAEERKVREALSLLKDHDASSYEECKTFIDTIYLTGSTEGHYIRSGCNFNLFGLIFLYAHESNTVPYYIEHIVHECAHHALNIINADDYIVENAPEERFSAPFRKDKRPMIGIFHALFVLSRIAQSLSRFTASYRGTYENEFSQRLDTALTKYQQTVQIVEEHAKLTPKGKEILKGIKEVMKDVGAVYEN